MLADGRPGALSTALRVPATNETHTIEQYKRLYILKKTWLIYCPNVPAAAQAELLADGHPGALSTALRVPATSRTQKLHNTGLALARLVHAGALPLPPSGIADAARDIVDGHQVGRQTLQTSWTD